MNKLTLLLWRLPFKTKRMKLYLAEQAELELDAKKQELIRLRWEQEKLKRKLKELKEREPST